VTHRELKQGETNVQKYRMADFPLPQLRCGIQGTARMLPSRIVSHVVLPVSGTDVEQTSHTNAVGNSPTDDDYDHINAADVKSWDCKVQSSKL
jgi:hypothetical protein